MIAAAKRVTARLTNAFAATVITLYVSAAWAGAADTSIFSFNGFGTLGVAHSSEDQADFTSTFFKPSGAGYTDEWSLDVDSLLGAQVTADLTSQLSAVVQVIAEQNYDGTYRPHVEWANIKYAFTPDFSVRVGRTVLPIALLSESRKVGYTYAWVRPPLETYRLVPLTNSDGLDITYRLRSGDLTNTVQVGVGRNDTHVPNDGGSIETRRLRVISSTTEFGSFTGHIAYLRSRATLADLNRSLFDVFRQFGPRGAEIADEFGLNDSSFSLLSFGALYDPGSWFVTGEWGRLKSRSFIGGSAWHASGGYRLGQLMPYATYARTRADKLADPGLDVSTLPPSLAGPARALNAGLSALLSSNAVQSTVSLGGRWDFMTNGSFKLQLDHIDIGAGSSGPLSNPQPGLQLGDNVDIFSVTIDFVF
jgi:hypothetical protein